MTSFFISYNRADRGWAEWMAWMLEDEGHKTILDLSAVYTQPEWAAAFAVDPKGEAHNFLSACATVSRQAYLTPSFMST